VGLNFSSATTPELLLKTFDHYCEYRRTPNGVVLAPVQLGKWLVLFCDEINLPDMDKYGTQRVISFLRQVRRSQRVHPYTRTGCVSIGCNMTPSSMTFLPISGTEVKETRKDAI
jgi:hypothetical protein